MTKIRTKRVRLKAAEPVELEEGVIMPPGAYVGKSKELGVPTIGRRAGWAAPTYEISFSAEQLYAMGMKTQNGLKSIDWDVTPFIASKQITVVRRAVSLSRYQRFS